jgi:hypothetical protein
MAGGLQAAECQSPSSANDALEGKHGQRLVISVSDEEMHCGVLRLQRIEVLQYHR